MTASEVGGALRSSGVAEEDGGAPGAVTCVGVGGVLADHSLLCHPGVPALGEHADAHDGFAGAVLRPCDVDVADASGVVHDWLPKSSSRSWFLRIFPAAVTGISATMRIDSGQ